MIRKDLKFIIAIAYTAFTIWILFFCPYINPSRVQHNAVEAPLLLPFQSTAHYIWLAWHYHDMNNIMEFITNIGGNILLFMPLGALLADGRWYHKPWWMPLLTGALISLTVETIQLLTHVGYFEVDDIIWNAAGTLLGFVLWKEVVRFFYQPAVRY